jgi:hypothetical protein
MKMIEASALLEHWAQWPPEHESLAFLAMAHGWRPPHRELTPAEEAEELDRKYRSGYYLRPDQLAGIFGGVQHLKPGDKVPGVGPLPWPEMQLPKET